VPFHGERLKGLDSFHALTELAKQVMVVSPGAIALWKGVGEEGNTQRGGI
jgi:hypothetical protein